MDEKDKKIKRLEEVLESSNGLSWQRAQIIIDLREQVKALTRVIQEIKNESND
jgi:hypothetical protein